MRGNKRGSRLTIESHLRIGDRSRVGFPLSACFYVPRADEGRPSRALLSPSHNLADMNPAEAAYVFSRSLSALCNVDTTSQTWPWSHRDVPQCPPPGCHDCTGVLLLHDLQEVRSLLILSVSMLKGAYRDRTWIKIYVCLLCTSTRTLTGTHDTAGLVPSGSGHSQRDIRHDVGLWGPRHKLR